MAKDDCAGLLEYVSKVSNFSHTYGKYHKWLKENGKCFTVKKGYKPSKRIQKKLETFEAEVKGCYGNSLRAALYDYDKELQYYEGYFIDEKVPIPIEHAWTVDKKTGQVVDSTVLGAWTKIEDKEPGEINYFGLPIPNEYVMKESLRDSCYTPRLGQYWSEEVKK